MTLAGAPRVIAVGDNCLDVYLTKGRMAVGGNALNVAAGWAARGLDARYFGAVGQDREADVVLNAVAGAGLAPEDVERKTRSTAVTLLLERDGDRRFLLEDLGAGQDYVPDAARYDQLADADWIHLGTHTNPELVQQLVRDSRAFSVDVSTAHDTLPLEGVPLVFASGPEEADSDVEPIFAKFRERGALRTVVTCGRRGAFFDDGAAIWFIPAQEVRVVDTCGAGDSFIAAFIHAYLLSGIPAMPALATATEAAAHTCTHEGGFPQTLITIPAWLLEKYADVIACAEN